MYMYIFLFQRYTASKNGEEMEQEDGSEIDGLIQWSNELDYDKSVQSLSLLFL